MNIHLIAAVSGDGFIANEQGQIPWKLRDDLAYFSKKTKGRDRAVIMGRNTYFSIGNHALPDRLNIVVSKSLYYHSGLIWDSVVYPSIDMALGLCEGDGITDVFFIGGTEIYREGFRHAEFLHITEVKTKVGKGVVFPTIPSEFRELGRACYSKDARNSHDYDFIVYSK